MTPSLLFLLALLSGATDAPLATNAPAAAPLPGLREISPGILEYHGIQLDKKNRRISFPAKVNQREGAIEYLLVNEKGKVHESVLETSVAPHDIHLALLLIGLPDDDKAKSKETAPPSAIDATYLQSAPKLSGPPVRLTVAWTQDGKPKEAPAEEWIFNTDTKHAMTIGPWTYNGSLIEDGVFLADQDFSLIAVITDPTALVNNTRPGYNNEDIWQVRTEAVPALDTAVVITITLVNPAP